MLDADHPLVAGLVRQPRRTDDVADGVQPGLAAWRATGRRRCGPSRPPRGCVSRPTSSTLPVMPTASMTRSTVTGETIPPPRSITAVTSSRRFSIDCTVAPVWTCMPRFSKILRAAAAISSSSAGQDARQRLDHRHLGAHVVIEARELDADRAGADDQQRARQPLGHHRFLVGPHQLPVRLESRQRARAARRWRG